jgi:hypothetical protein
MGERYVPKRTISTLLAVGIGMLAFSGSKDTSQSVEHLPAPHTLHASIPEGMVVPESVYLSFFETTVEYVAREEEAARTGLLQELIACGEPQAGQDPHYLYALIRVRNANGAIVEQMAGLPDAVACQDGVIHHDDYDAL